MTRHTTWTAKGIRLITSDLNCKSQHAVLKHLQSGYVNITSSRNKYIIFHLWIELVASLESQLVQGLHQTDNQTERATYCKAYGMSQWSWPCITARPCQSLLHTLQVFRSLACTVYSSTAELYHTRSFTFWTRSPKKFSFTWICIISVSSSWTPPTQISTWNLMFLQAQFKSMSLCKHLLPWKEKFNLVW